MAEYKYLDLIGLGYYDEKLKQFISAKDAEVLAATDPAGTAATKVQELADGQVKANKEAIGSLESLETTSKNDLVNAINEVRNSVSAGGTAAAITIDTAITTEGALKSYTFKQGDNVVGTIDIPKDMVVQSGEVVNLADGDVEGISAGTYIKLVLANATNDEIYVNVGNLVDIYKAHANAAQVQLAIDASTREISATIVAESVTATELAANAVTTVKIADGNVTKAKLSTEVQGFLDKADAAAVALAEGGAIDIKIGGAKEEAISTAAGDATSKADKALADAKTYADEKAAANAKAISDHETLAAQTYETKEDATAKYNEVKGDIENLGDLAAKNLVSESDLDEDLKAKVNASAEANHSHTNKDVLDGITAEKVAAWDAAEQNAKDHADDLNNAMDTRMKEVEDRFGDGEGSVADMIADAKADASNKDAVVLAEAQKAAADVQTALDTHTGNADIHVTAADKVKWNAAIQAADITTGTANGTIAVKGADVAVKGLGSAAYVATTAFDASGSAAQALTDANAYTDAAISKFVEVSEEDINALFA